MPHPLFKPVHLDLAFATLVLCVSVASLVVGVEVKALGLSQGGRISKATLCILDTPSPPAKPTTCAASCPKCSLDWPEASCATRVQVDFTPAGGIGDYACPAQTERYLGGGVFPRVGGWALFKAFFLGGSLLVPGIGR